MTDPMDQPEDDGYGLVMPFVVCQTNGGPYDVDAFAAVDQDAKDGAQ